MREGRRKEGRRRKGRENGRKEGRKDEEKGERREGRLVERKGAKWRDWGRRVRAGHQERSNGIEKGKVTRIWRGYNQLKKKEKY